MGFALLACRLVYRRGWRKVLPVFSLGVLFYCLTTIPLFLLEAHSVAHPDQRIACLIYRYTDWAVFIINILFLISVLYELLIYTMPENRNIRRRSSVLFGSGALVLATTGVFVFHSCFQVTYCCAVDRFLCIAGNAGNLVVIGLTGLLILLKENFGVTWGRSLWLIVLAPTLFYALQIPGFFLVLDGANEWLQSSEAAITVCRFGWLFFWWLAVRKAPEVPTTQPSVAAVPAN